MKSFPQSRKSDQGERAELRRLEKQVKKTELPRFEKQVKKMTFQHWHSQGKLPFCKCDFAAGPAGSQLSPEEVDKCTIVNTSWIINASTISCGPLHIAGTCPGRRAKESKGEDAADQRRYPAISFRGRSGGLPGGGGGGSRPGAPRL